MPKTKTMIAERKKPGPKPQMRGRRSSAGPKQPFSIVLDARELQALKTIARKKQCSVASLIRGAMNAVIFQANPQLARAALEKDIEHFLDGIKSKLPMSTRFEGRKKGLKRSLVEGIMSEMENA